MLYLFFSHDCICGVNGNESIHEWINGYRGERVLKSH